ncbi:MAG TPA: TMEM14 family protein [Verrucomicrobiae bacterium]
MQPNTILWIYIVLLLVGGMIGFLKAGSKVSLLSSSVAAAVLVVMTMPSVFQRNFRQTAAEIIMAALLVVFAIRLGKTKKFMPSGLMLLLTLAFLAMFHFAH